jgi:hypothetical protein
MNNATKVYNSTHGAVGTKDQAGAGNLGDFKQRALLDTTDIIDSYLKLQKDFIDTLRGFDAQEKRFFRHWNHPDWCGAKMPGTENLVLGELKIVLLSTSGYRQTRATWLLNKGASPMGVDASQLKELTAHADAFNEYVNSYNMVTEQGLDATIRFIQAYPFKTNIMELMEVADGTV